VTWALFRFPWEDDEARESRTLRHIAFQLDRILRNQERLMSDQETANALAAEIESDLQAEDADLDAIKQKLADLQNQNPNVDFSSLTQAVNDLDAARAREDAVAQNQPAAGSTDGDGTEGAGSVDPTNPVIPSIGEPTVGETDQIPLDGTQTTTGTNPVPEPQPVDTSTVDEEPEAAE
jgi:chromosome segregation ATPase